MAPAAGRLSWYGGIRGSDIVLPGWAMAPGLLASFTFLRTSPGAARAGTTTPTFVQIRLAWSSRPAGVSLVFLQRNLSSVGHKPGLDGRLRIVSVP